MPVSEALRRLSEDPAFWAALRHDDRASADHLGGELRASFPVAGGYGLVLDLDLGAGDQALGLREPRTDEPVQLGWAANGRPHPAALRWWELDLCARVIAIDDPTLPHPGLVVALLSPFAPVTPDDDAAANRRPSSSETGETRRSSATALRCAEFRTDMGRPAYRSWRPDPAAGRMG